ncbi:TonB-dependent receptor [Luteithermobacter gelatinilyticus]|uniref:TonB-dependent receptor n=1 Tax=Luteithermobacter gelatinilyticus TaxID=2582913 RepID=UPI00110673F8|nr:TonB-dependent receptor [Luteithermobacter gelatinilyticus]
MYDTSVPWTRRLAVPVMACSFVALAPAAMAAEESTAVIEEIIVSAQKRDQSIQDVPIAISAYDANFIERTKLDDVKDMITFTPGFSGQTKDSFVDAINIRGISTNSFGSAVDPSIGIFKDGIYQGRTGSAITSFFDIERAEALRGPQGFLFGRNASSGAISIITQKPTTEGVEGYVHAGIAERGHIELDAALNVPLNQNWAIRMAGYSLEEDGHVTNQFAPEADKQQFQDKKAARVSIGYESEDLSFTLIAEAEDRRQSGTIYRAIDASDGTLDFFGVTLRGSREDSDSDFLEDIDEGNILSLTALLDWKWGDLTFTSISGYRDYDYRYAEDFDGAPFTSNHYLQDQEGDYYSQEFRLLSPDTGRLTWYVGVSAYKENIKTLFTQIADEEIMCQAFYETDCTTAVTDPDGDFGFDEFIPNPDGLVESNDIIGEYTGWAAYADLTYAVTEKLELSFDLRYTYDKKDFSLRVHEVESQLGPFFAFGYITDGYVSGSESWDDFTPRFVARYAVTDDLNVWASVTRGYKAGGFGSFTLDIPLNGATDIFEVLDEDGVVPEGTKPAAFDPETLWSYEAGLKADLADRKVQLAVNTYYYTFKDLQVSFFDEDTFNTMVANVGEVDGYGIEASVRALASDNVDMLLGFAWADTSVEGADAICDDCDGNRLTNNPEWTLTGVINGHYPMGSDELFATAEFRYQSKVYGGLENDETISIDGWTEVNLRVGYESANGWEVSVYAENLLDDFHYDGVSLNELPIPSHNFGFARPRTFGVDFTYRFGK